jgi:hypothetical protein
MFPNVEKLQIGNGALLYGEPLLRLRHLKELDCVPGMTTNQTELQNLEKLVNQQQEETENLSHEARLQLAEKTFQWTYKFKLPARMADIASPLLAKLPLQELDVSFTAITDSDLESISKIETLQKLHLSGCDQITSNGIAYLERLPNLKEICIDEASRRKISLRNTMQVKPLNEYFCEILRRTIYTVLDMLYTIFACIDIASHYLLGTNNHRAPASF